MLDINSQSGMPTIEDDHAAQLELCRQLEEIADSLPDDVDAAQCQAVATMLHTTMASVDQYFRTHLSKAAACEGMVLIDLKRMTERLAQENRQDLDAAEDLADLLQAMAQNRARVPAEALGYMLRGFFQSRRRRIALEQELLDALKSESR